MTKMSLKHTKNLKLIKIASVILSLLGYYVYRNSRAYKKYFHFANKMKDIPDDLQIVNLGTTAAFYAFDYSKIKVPAMNMAIYTQTFNYDLKILQKYAKHISENAIILITIEYPIFLFPDIPENRPEVHNQFNKILRVENKNLSKTLKSYCLLLFPFFIKKSAGSILHMINLETENGKKNHFTLREREAKIAEKIKGWWSACGLTEKDLSEDKLSVQVKKRLNASCLNLNELLNYCMDMSWKPVLILLPYSKQMNESLEQVLLNRICYSNLSDFIERGIPLLDYSHDPRLSDGDLYMDMEYLNEKGRALFSDIVIQDLVKINGLDLKRI